MSHSQTRVTPCQKYQDKLNYFPTFAQQPKASERKRNSHQIYQDSNPILSESSSKSDSVKTRSKKRNKLKNETEEVKRKPKPANKKRSRKPQESTDKNNTADKKNRRSKSSETICANEIKRNIKFDRIIEAIKNEESLKRAKKTKKPDWRTWLNFKIESDKQESDSEDDAVLRNLSEFIFTIDCQTEKRDCYSKWMSHYDNYPKYRRQGVNYKRFLTNGRDPMLTDQASDFKRCFVYDKVKRLSDMETKAGLIMTSWENKLYCKREYKKRKSLDYF